MPGELSQVGGELPLTTGRKAAGHDVGSLDSEYLHLVAAEGWNLQQPLSWARVRMYLLQTGVPRGRTPVVKDGGLGGTMKWQGEKAV